MIQTLLLNDQQSKDRELDQPNEDLNNAYE